MRPSVSKKLTISGLAVAAVAVGLVTIVTQSSGQAQQGKGKGPEPLPITKDSRFSQYVLARRYACVDWVGYYELVYLRRDLYDRQAA